MFGTFLSSSYALLWPIRWISIHCQYPPVKLPPSTFSSSAAVVSNMMRSAFLCSALFALLLVAPNVTAQGFSPEDAVQRMKVPDGFQVKLVACEPMIRQPVTMTFDDRGRLWVIQYLQYPAPAGLKPVTVDQYLRTVYDRIPEPPPKGPRGADRITILSDPDENGRFRKSKDFVTGLNLASGMALGHGGVFVVQPPYLLFYPDRNGDDIPDGDPEVLLNGFGMHDAHAFPNSLQWGPDGWLYGAQGSTITSNIRGITFQQGIWRFHPLTKEFELFSEGGGNTWGLDFDAHGNAIAGTNWGNSVCLHQVQGAYYVKGFAKHGELQNPHAYGYFDHVPYKGFKGGHVTMAGIFYQGGAFPREFDNAYIAANPLANAIYWHRLTPKASTFTGEFAGDFMIANDTWCRPVDLLVGPDGAVYFADWYDKRLNHVDPVDNWDRTNGRIFRIEHKGQTTTPKFGLSRLSSMQLVEMLGHKNEWYVREAQRLLAERRDPSVVPGLLKMIAEAQDPLGLQALWALYVSGGFNDTVAESLLDHPNPDIRAWTIRLLGDARRVSPLLRDRLLRLARAEPNSTVRCQLACTCKRLPGKDCLPVVRELLCRNEDVNDPFIPLLLWWAIEDKGTSDRASVLQLLEDSSSWRLPLVRQHIIERLGRRYMSAGSDLDLETCAKLLTLAPGEQESRLVLEGMEKALTGRVVKKIPAELAERFRELRDKQPASLLLVRLGLRLNEESALQESLRRISDTKETAGDRVSLIEIVGQCGKPECVPILLQVLESNQPSQIRMAALSALQQFTDPVIADKVLMLYPNLPGELRPRAQTLLSSRLVSARQFLETVDQGRINPKEVPLDQVRRILLHKDETIARIVEKHWGKVGKESQGEKRARINSIRHMLGTGTGHPERGKEFFKTKCATCHTLFGEGNKIGPDLTGTDRRDTEFMVASIVDPSAVIRNEYVAYVVVTTNGRLLTGLITESTPGAITVVDAKNERTTLARSDIETLKASTESLMPEKILDDLDEQQIRDLLSYVQSRIAETAPGTKQPTQPTTKKR